MATVCTPQTPNPSAQHHPDATLLGIAGGGKIHYQCPNCEREWPNEKNGETPSFLEAYQEETPVSATDAPVSDAEIRRLEAAGYQISRADEPLTPDRILQWAHESAAEQRVKEDPVAAALVVLVTERGQFLPFRSDTPAPTMLALGAVADMVAKGLLTEDQG